MRKIPFILSLFAFMLNCAFAANWDDPGVNLVQSISDHRFRDANTGQIVSTNGMPDSMKNPMSAGANPAPNPAPAPNPTSAPAPNQAPAPAPNPAPAPAPNQAPAPAPNQAPAPAPNQAASTTKWYQNKGAAGMSTTGKVIAAGTAVAGTVGLVQSASGSGEHGAGNMVSGITSGIAAGCSIGSFFPVYGTLIGCAVGLVAGAVVPGSQLFSETDCLHDPITKKYTCCNTVFNKGERQVEIGGYMFCGTEGDNQTVLPGVRQCLQGGSDKAASWWSGLWKDDAWSAECKIRWCKDEPPADTDILIFADEEKFCFNWKPKDGDSNGGSGGGAITDPYLLTIQKIEYQMQILQTQCGSNILN